MIQTLKEATKENAAKIKEKGNFEQFYDELHMHITLQKRN